MKTNIEFLIEETLEDLESDFEITIEEPAPRRIAKIKLEKIFLIEPMALEQKQVNEKVNIGYKILTFRRFLKSLIRF